MGLGRGKMKNNNQIQIIENKIFTVRGQQVMLDRDLAELYQVTTKRLNEQVKRNIDKFEKFFSSYLVKKKMNWSQIATG
jgi:hypothetical protein